ncbi:hypothetical protein GCM10009716_32370 [Streptomyces sodiiphilus]|uniref:Fructosamine kinase n=1 Tax=Streptomyces sodiiphilus TaxID=226217 RepID=A0ABN2PGK2_9ACTN
MTARTADAAGGGGIGARVAALAGARSGRASAVGGGAICAAHRVELDDGRTVFAKTPAGAPGDFFPAGAAGLERLWSAERSGRPGRPWRMTGAATGGPRTRGGRHDDR